MAMKEVGAELPDVWSPEKEGDNIEGIYVKKKENVGKNNANLYIIDVGGVFKSIWGSTVLDDKMDHVFEKDQIRITYLGDDKDKGYHKFKVEKEELEDEEETDSDEEPTPMIAQE